MAFAVLRCLMIGASLTSFAWSKAALSFDDTAAIAINPKHTAVYLHLGNHRQSAGTRHAHSGRRRHANR